MNIQLLYKIEKKKFKLPDYKELNFEFDISSIESNDFVLRAIRKKIIEKIDSYTTILGDLLQPDAGISSMHELNFVDEKVKQDIINLYSKMMTIKRESEKIEIYNDEKENADFINFVLVEWKNLKQKLLKTMTLLKESWKKEDEVVKDLGYLG